MWNEKKERKKKSTDLQSQVFTHCPLSKLQYQHKFWYEEDASDHMFPISNYTTLLPPPNNPWQFVETIQLHPIYTPHFGY